MNYLIGFIFFSIFTYLNTKILISDIKKNIIPNKYLLYLIFLIPFFYGFYIFFIDFSFNFYFLLQFFISFITTFILYYFGIWGAGDAKYLLVLSLFIPNIGIIPFIGNIAILIIIYLLIYFLYFYLGKCLIKPNYTKDLYKGIYIDLKDKFLIFIKHTDGNIYFKTSFKIILNWFLLFLFFFVGIRLVRFIFINKMFENKSNISDLSNLLKTYHIYFGIILFSFFWIIQFLFRSFFRKIRFYLTKKLKITNNKTNLFFPILLSSILIIFILYEYIVNPYEIGKYLYKIFTYYIILFLVIRILLYSYNITFVIGETQYLNIKDLKEGKIVDKDYLVKLFGEQDCLLLGDSKGILSPNPKLYFLHIENPIDEETCDKLKEIYKIINDYHLKNNTPNFSENNTIKILKTFAFSPYIFVGFIMTCLFGDNIFKFIFSFFPNILKSIIH